LATANPSKISLSQFWTMSTFHMARALLTETMFKAKNKTPNYTFYNQKNPTKMQWHRKQLWTQIHPLFKPPPSTPRKAKNILLQQSHPNKTRIQSHTWTIQTIPQLYANH
jgi:hypothetical protein